MKSNIKTYYRNLKRAEKRAKISKRRRINKIKTATAFKKIYTDDVIQNLVYRPMSISGLFGIR